MKILPEECIANIIALTSPRDACRLAVVSPLFKSVADSDVVWKRFLPSDYHQIIPKSPQLFSLSKKDLFFHLCNNPIIINNGTMSFAIDKDSGKKSLMVGAKELTVVWGDTPEYWLWPSLPESRFAQVAELNYVWWLEVKGRMETSILSPKTTYTVYLVFNFSEYVGGFEEVPVKLGLYFEGRDDGNRRCIYLNPEGNIPQLSRDRGDGRIEIEMGEFFNDNGDDGAVLYSLFDDTSCVKEGLIIEGIEFRPKNSI